MLGRGADRSGGVGQGKGLTCRQGRPEGGVENRAQKPASKRKRAREGASPLNMIPVQNLFNAIGLSTQ